MEKEDKTKGAKRKTSTKPSAKRKDGLLMKVAKKEWRRDKKKKAMFWEAVNRVRTEAKVGMKKNSMRLPAPSPLVPERTFVSSSRPSSPPPVLETYESEFQASVNSNGEPILRTRNLVPVNRR